MWHNVRRGDVRIPFRVHVSANYLTTLLLYYM